MVPQRRAGLPVRVHVGPRPAGGDHVRRVPVVLGRDDPAVQVHHRVVVQGVDLLDDRPAPRDGPDGGPGEQAVVRHDPSADARQDLGFGMPHGDLVVVRRRRPGRRPKHRRHGERNGERGGRDYLPLAVPRRPDHRCRDRHQGGGAAGRPVLDQISPAEHGRPFRSRALPPDDPALRSKDAGSPVAAEPHGSPPSHRAVDESRCRPRPVDAAVVGKAFVRWTGATTNATGVEP